MDPATVLTTFSRTDSLRIPLAIIRISFLKGNSTAQATVNIPFFVLCTTMSHYCSLCEHGLGRATLTNVHILYSLHYYVVLMFTM